MFERTGGGMGAEPSPAPRLGDAAPTAETSPAMRLQILSTEHWSLLAWTPTVVAILNAVLVGAILAIGAVRSGGSPTTALLVGGAGFVVAVALERWYVQRGIDKLRAGLHPLFPTPDKG